MHRLFVAVDLPEKIKEALGDLQVGLPGAGWMPLDALHLTVRFIGEVETSQADDIDAALGSLRADPFQITLAGLGIFGNRRRARTLWVGVMPSRPLAGLKHKIDAALAGAGIERESRKFTPHVTLARLAGAGRGGVQAYLENGPAPMPEMSLPVERFSLYSSILSPTGAIHALEAAYPLGDQ